MVVAMRASNKRERRHNIMSTLVSLGAAKRILHGVTEKRKLVKKGRRLRTVWTNNG